MQEEKGKSTEQETPNPKKKRFSSLFRKKTASKHPTTKDQKGNTTNVNKEPYNIIINIPEKEDSGANKIAVVNMLVTAALTLFTYLLFLQTKNTLNEYKKEFEEVNRPYIIITNFKSLDTVINKPNLVCTFNIINTGKFPAKLKYFTLKEIIGEDTLTPFTEGHRSMIVQNEFLPYTGTYIVNDVITVANPYKKYIFLGKAKLFLVLDYEYFNDMLNKKYIVHDYYGIYYQENKMNKAEKISSSEIEEDL